MSERTSGIISLKPESETAAVCPQCQSVAFDRKRTWFHGIHVLVEGRCKSCQIDYYQTLPLAHTRHFPISFSVDGRFNLYAQAAHSWLAQPLIQSVVTKQYVDYPITIKSFKSIKGEVILLNVLDFCYGHILLKLANAQILLTRFPDKDLIVLLPASFEWMIPEGIAEAWLVEGRLGGMIKEIKNLDSLVQEQWPRFTNVALASPAVHPESTKINWETFLHTSRFSLNDFALKPLRICFVHREDRLWINNRLELFINKVCRKLGWYTWTKKLFLARQNVRFARTARKIRKQFPETEFYLAGLGKPGRLPYPLQDQRNPNPDKAQELAWCTLYASCQIVIGVHGSNMLIPTALSGGFVEILPHHKIDHITEDVVHIHPNRWAAFLGRYVSEFASAKEVAAHACAMYKNFTFFKKTTEEL